ncbi:MAG: hypothetical protein MHM6MM_001836 [Cercozoa sp. M6MM]
MDPLQQLVMGQSTAPSAVHLRSCHGRFLCATPEGILIADRDSSSVWETFTVIPSPSVPGAFALQTAHGSYVCAEGSGMMVANRMDINDPDTAMRFLITAPGTCVLQSARYSKYMSAQPDGRLECNRDQVQQWETFYYMIAGMVPMQQPVLQPMQPMPMQPTQPQPIQMQPVQQQAPTTGTFVPSPVNVSPADHTFEIEDKTDEGAKTCGMDALKVKRVILVIKMIMGIISFVLAYQAWSAWDDAGDEFVILEKNFNTPPVVDAIWVHTSVSGREPSACPNDYEPADPLFFPGVQRTNDSSTFCGSTNINIEPSKMSDTGCPAGSNTILRPVEPVPLFFTSEHCAFEGVQPGDSSIPNNPCGLRSDNPVDGSLSQTAQDPVRRLGTLCVKRGTQNARERKSVFGDAACPKHMFKCTDSNETEATTEYQCVDSEFDCPWTEMAVFSTNQALPAPADDTTDTKVSLGEWKCAGMGSTDMQTVVCGRATSGGAPLTVVGKFGGGARCLKNNGRSHSRSGGIGGLLTTYSKLGDLVYSLSNEKIDKEMRERYQKCDNPDPRWITVHKESESSMWWANLYKSSTKYHAFQAHGEPSIDISLLAFQQVEWRAGVEGTTCDVSRDTIASRAEGVNNLVNAQLVLAILSGAIALCVNILYGAWEFAQKDDPGWHDDTPEQVTRRRMKIGLVLLAGLVKMILLVVCLAWSGALWRVFDGVSSDGCTTDEATLDALEFLEVNIAKIRKFNIALFCVAFVGLALEVRALYKSYKVPICRLSSCLWLSLPRTGP